MILTTMNVINLRKYLLIKQGERGFRCGGSAHDISRADNLSFFTGISSFKPTVELLF